MDNLACAKYTQDIVNKLDAILSDTADLNEVRLELLGLTQDLWRVIYELEGGW